MFATSWIRRLKLHLWFLTPLLILLIMPLLIPLLMDCGVEFVAHLVDHYEVSSLGIEDTRENEFWIARVGARESYVAVIRLDTGNYTFSAQTYLSDDHGEAPGSNYFRPPDIKNTPGVENTPLSEKQKNQIRQWLDELPQPSFGEKYLPGASRVHVSYYSHGVLRYASYDADRIHGKILDLQQIIGPDLAINANFKPATIKQALTFRKVRAIY